MQFLGFQIDGVLRFRSEDEQAILVEGLTFDEFIALDDQLNTMMQTDIPTIDLGQTIS
jgi:hypothetical protein